MLAGRRLVVVAVLVAVVTNFVVATHREKLVGSDRKRILDVGQGILDDIRTSMIGAAVLAHGDGQWLQRLDLSAAPPIESSQLPAATAAREFGREASPGARTGNALLFASPTRRVVMRSDAGRTHRIQLYRFIAYYLTITGAGPRPDRSGGLNIARFTSVRVVDGDQIDGIPDPTERARILQKLASNRGAQSVTWVWRRRGDSAGVYRIDPESGELRSGVVLPADPARSKAGLLPADRMSVASNFADPTAGVAALARRSDDRGGFPHGFEVQISSPMTRQVMLHLTLTSHRSTKPVIANLRGIALVREI